MTLTRFLKKEWQSLLLLAAPFVVLLFVWDRVPDVVPTHWTFSGEADRYGDKFPALLLIPGINMGVYLLILFAPKIDPKRRLAWDQKPLPALRFFTVLFFDLLFFVMLGEALGLPFVDMDRLLPLGLVLLFLVLGNYITTVQHNYFIGIRTPWTLEDEEVWRKTHRLGGRLWVGVSILLLALWPLLAPETFRTVFFAGLMVMVIVPLLYSYFAYTAKQRASRSDPSEGSTRASEAEST